MGNHIGVFTQTNPNGEQIRILSDVYVSRLLLFNVSLNLII